MKIKRILKNLLRRRNVIESFNEGDRKLQVVEYSWFLRIKPTTISIDDVTEKSIDGRYNLYSVIYKQTNKKFQPYQTKKETMFDMWNKSRSIKRALVLGCAGCAMPRFFNLSFFDSETIGVEYSERLVEIANKYFLDGIDKDRFQLIHGDAFEYTQNYKGEPFDAIYIDVFKGMDICPEVISDKFISEIYNILNKNGIVIINVIRGANTVRKAFMKYFPWVSYTKEDADNDSSVVAIKSESIEPIVKWKTRLLKEKLVWI